MIATKLLSRLPLTMKRPQLYAPLFVRYLCENEKITWTNEKLEQTVKKNQVVVFMKGVPAQPMCGFSNAVVQILKMHGVEKYDSYNILDDQELRQRVKEFSNWPTIPQIYLGGEFIGGCDIFLQMHQNGELIEELLKLGIKSALLERAIEKEEHKDDEK